MGLLDDAIREHLDLKRRRGADPAEVERAEREALGPVRRNRDPSESLDSDPSAEAQPGAIAFDHEHDEEGWDDEPQGRTATAGDRGPEVVPPPVFDDDLAVSQSAARPPAYDDEPRHRDEPAYEDEPAHRGESAYGDDEPGFADEPRSPSEAHYAEEPRYADEPRGAEEPRYADEPRGAAEEPVRPAAEDEERSWTAADDVDDLEPFPTASAPPSRSADPVGEETTEYHIEQRLPHDDEDEVLDDDVLEETPEFLQDTPDHDRLWFEQRPPRDFDFDG